jgi:hypothetical protein
MTESYHSDGKDRYADLVMGASVATELPGKAPSQTEVRNEGICRVYVAACQSARVIHSRDSFSLQPRVHVAACQSAPLIRSCDSFSLQPRVYVAACQSAPFSLDPCHVSNENDYQTCALLVRRVSRYRTCHSGPCYFVA